MNGLALCAGVGGLELGLKLAIGDAYRTVCYVEREAFAAATLVARMEESNLDSAPIWDSLESFDGEPWRGLVDIITSGFPCQPASTAGRRKGTVDERWVWPEIARIIRKVRPRLVFLENVPGLLSVNARRAFGEILGDLAALGYNAEWDVFSARGMGASHRRDRIFILAVDNDNGHESALRQTNNDKGMANPKQSELQVSPSSPTDKERGGTSTRTGGELDDTTRTGFIRTEQPEDDRCSKSRGETTYSDSAGEGCVDDTYNPKSQGRQSSGNESSTYKLPPWPPSPSDLDSWRRVLELDPTLEPAIRRVADGTASRVDRLRTLGNAVIPVCAAVAFLHLGERLGVIQ